MKYILFIFAVFAICMAAIAQTPIGGSIYQVMNTSGGTLYRGQVVCGDSTSLGVWAPFSIVKCPDAALYPIGTVYNDSIVNNGLGFITSSGSGYVAVANTKAKKVVPENRVLTTQSGAVGLANCVVPDTNVIHYEIGCPVTKMVGMNYNGDSICIADIHKN